MSEEIKSEMISRRRAFSLLGLAAASGFVLPAEMWTASDSAAQTQTQTQTQTNAPAPSGPQSGTERRQERRTHRTERRQERRTHRTERRTERRKGRHERRAKRHGGGEATEKK
jgi:hypothetical protein